MALGRSAWTDGATAWPLCTDSWGEEEIDAAMNVLRAGRRTMGEEVAAFEAEFAAYVGARHAVAVNSGSSANLLAIAALRYHSTHPLVPGDEVIVPALAWSTTYAPLYQHGLSIRLVDIDRGTLNLTAENVARVVTERTRAVVAVHVLGNPCPMQSLRDVLPESVMIVEDACEAMGATFGGKHVGTIGIAGTYSTFFSHHMTTGEGGLVVTDDDELYHLMLVLRAHGWTRDLPAVNILAEKTPSRFGDDYRFILPGYNLRPTEIQGAVGRVQLRKLPAFLSARRRNAVRVRAYVGDAPWLEVQRPDGDSSWMAFALTLADDAPINRAALLRIMGQHGIETRPIVGGNVARSEMAQRLGIVDTDLPNADRVDRDGIMIGNHPVRLSYGQIGALAAALRGACPEQHARS